MSNVLSTRLKKLECRVPPPESEDSVIVLDLGDSIGDEHMMTITFNTSDSFDRAFRPKPSGWREQ